MGARGPVSSRSGPGSNQPPVRKINRDRNSENSNAETSKSNFENLLVKLIDHKSGVILLYKNA